MCQCHLFALHRIVKLSSPYVNVMIIAGAIVFYVTVILFGVDENITSFSVVDGLCHARVWLCVIGFSLLYGTIFAKALRIYYIFSHLKPNSKVVCNITGKLFQKWTIIASPFYSSHSFAHFGLW